MMNAGRARYGASGVALLCPLRLHLDVPNETLFFINP